MNAKGMVTLHKIVLINKRKRCALWLPFQMMILDSELEESETQDENDEDDESEGNYAWKWQQRRRGSNAWLWDIEHDHLHHPENLRATISIHYVFGICGGRVDINLFPVVPSYEIIPPIKTPLRSAYSVKCNLPNEHRNTHKACVRIVSKLESITNDPIQIWWIRLIANKWKSLGQDLYRIYSTCYLYPLETTHVLPTRD